MLGAFQPGIDSSLGHMAPEAQHLRHHLLTQTSMLHISTSSRPPPDNTESCHLRGATALHRLRARASFAIYTVIYMQQAIYGQA